MTGTADADSIALTYLIYSGGAVYANGVINLEKDTNVVVPVELISFSASIVNNYTELKWITATEVNNSGFEIQRSPDNKLFTTIDFIKGKGTTSEKNTYSYLDKNDVAGKYYYRLKQIDLNGSYEYSNIININITAPAKFELKQNYPNPFNPATSINYSIPFTSRVKLSIYNLLGQLVTTLVDECKDAGYYELNWNAENLTSGMYVYSLQVESINRDLKFKSIKKMILIK